MILPLLPSSDPASDPASEIGPEPGLKLFNQRKYD
jgi:hypothetical protein